MLALKKVVPFVTATCAFVGIASVPPVFANKVPSHHNLQASPARHQSRAVDSVVDQVAPAPRLPSNAENSVLKLAEIIDGADNRLGFYNVEKKLTYWWYIETRHGWAHTVLLCAASAGNPDTISVVFGHVHNLDRLSADRSA